MNLSPGRRQQLTRLTTLLIGIMALAAAVILWQWYRDGGGFEAVYVAVSVLFAALLVVRRWLKKEPATTAAGLSTWRQSPSASDALPALRRQMGQVFNLDDLRTLTFDFGLNYDNLAGETLDRKILSLLESCRTQNQLPELLAHLQRERPHVQWVQPGLQPLAAGPQELRNRENLLNQVQTAWIDGFLKQSLHSEVIKLSLSYRPDAVGQRPWQLVLQQTGQADQPVLPERTLPQIFDAAGRNLLILGAPGSGKSITMLQLAESLITAARADPAEPLPIVLNLSSWAQHKAALADWLVEEIFIQYGVAKDLTRAWIGGNRLLYLLDGLDEVAETARDGCIAAINTFKEQHPTEMVVCSRSEDYEKLHNRLRLGTAVHIQPLTPAQVDACLDQEGLELQAVRATLTHDPDLQELAQTPLVLSLMTLAYSGLTRTDLRPLANKEARRRHLFDHYVAQMFMHRPLPDDSPYTQTQALGWLANLAHGMEQHEHSIFYIERMQPTWLPHTYLHRYRRIFGLSREPIKLVEDLVWQIPSRQESWSVIKGGLDVGLILGLGVGLAIMLEGAPRHGLLVGLGIGLIVMLIYALGDGLKAFIRTREVPQRLQPNQGVWRSGWSGVRMALILGPIYGLGVSLIVGLGVGLGAGLDVGQRDVLIVGLIIGLTLGLTFGLGVVLFQYGGDAVIQHYSLRWLLARAGILPYPFRDGRLVAFLDAMRDRILLRRVGGGWIFVHRSVLEYFASLAEARK